LTTAAEDNKIKTYQLSDFNQADIVVVKNNVKISLEEWKKRKKNSEDSKKL
jgi:hypothetical protein